MTQAGIATLQISSKNLKLQVNSIYNQYQKIKEEAERWQSVLQLELRLGAPKVLVFMGQRANKVLEHLKKNGLQCPSTMKIPSYAYIMTKPDNNFETWAETSSPNRNLQAKNRLHRRTPFVRMQVIQFQML